MKNFKISIGLSIITAFMLIGCGDSSSSDEAVSYTDVTVERGLVIGSYVVDDNGVRGYNLGSGQYRFQTTPAYPITAYGGYIDVNRDGVVDANDTALRIPLSLNQQTRTKLTLLTTLAQDEELKDEILATYGLTEEELYTLTPSTSLKVSAISDIVFKYCTENNTTTSSIDLIALQ